MAKRGPLRLNIQRGASVAEFGRFLVDLEKAYLALYFLPTFGRGWRVRRRGHFDLFDFFDPVTTIFDNSAIYPDDNLVMARISIRSPGWIELVGSLNPLQQLREYLKDRHERKKDDKWRSRAEQERAELENAILRSQAERERIGVISEFAELMDQLGLSTEERSRLVWERLGGPLSRLAEHQDTGLLGSQNDKIDHPGE